MNEELKKFDVDELPIVEVTWIDHCNIGDSDGEPWQNLAEALEEAQPVTCREVGYVLLNSDTRVVLAHCISDCDGTKSLSVVLPNCITNWKVLWEPKPE